MDGRPDLVELEVAALDDRPHGVDHRRGVDRARAQVDHRHAGTRAPLGVEQAAGPAVGVLEAGGLGRVRGRGRDPAERGAAAHGENVLRPLAQVSHDVALRTALERVEPPAAVRAVDDAALDAEQREGLLARDDPLEQLGGLPRRLERERRVPQQPHPVLSRNSGSVSPRLPRPSAPRIAIDSPLHAPHSIQSMVGSMPPRRRGAGLIPQGGQPYPELQAGRGQTSRGPYRPAPGPVRTVQA